MNQSFQCSCKEKEPFITNRFTRMNHFFNTKFEEKNEKTNKKLILQYDESIQKKYQNTASFITQRQ